MDRRDGCAVRLAMRWPLPARSWVRVLLSTVRGSSIASGKRSRKDRKEKNDRKDCLKMHVC